MGRYNIHAGKFICQTCGEEVPTIRSYPSEKKLTWMCKQKHVSEVNLQTKKTKEDYE
jgi:hypothetical protein